MRLYQRVLIAIGAVLLVLGGLGTIKGLQIGRMVAHSKAFVPPAQTVAVAEVGSGHWETALHAVGSLEAVQGVMITAEMPGKVVRIAFEPGTRVTSGQLLVQQDITEERARLRAARSRAELALKNLERAKVLHKQKVISDASFDERKAAYEQASAEVDNIRAVIEKKTIRAPFAGRLGIRRINLGEVLEMGQSIVSLQSLDPIFANFQLPQQEVARLTPGMKVRASLGEDSPTAFEGTVTALNPGVDEASRNVRVQATLDNGDEQLRPGMYVSVAVVLPERRPVLTIPVTAVLHAPYSDSVFVVESRQSADGDAQQVLRQKFVQLGEKRGDFVDVRDGLNAGQTVVSTGVFKLRNGMPVTVDNTLAPEFKLQPRPENA